MAAVLAAPQGCVVGALACQKDSYLQVLETEIISCNKSPPPATGRNASRKKDKNAKDTNASEDVAEVWQIECADSVLFPEGGGQPTDHGTITPLSDSSSETIPISVVQRHGLRCVLYSPRPLPVGSKVRQEIDFKRRWDHMQQHTGQHLLSAVMDACDDLETLGWGMGADGEMNYVDLPRTPSREEMQEIQDKCNEHIRGNLPISVETPDDAKDDSLPDDYDKKGGVVRVITIEGVDKNPCCGTHLCQTSHITLILLHHTQPIHTKNCRMYFTAGDRAVRLASTSITTLRSIAGLFSSGTEANEVLSSAKRVLDAGSESRKKERKLLGEIAKFESERVKAVLKSGKNAWVYRAGEGLDYLNMVVFDVKDATSESGLVVLASGEGKKGGPVVIVGEKTAVDALVVKIKEVVVGIRGGGSGGRWQGKVTEWKKGELEALKQLVESDV